MKRLSAATIEKEKAIAVVRLTETDILEPVIEALYEGGIRLIEITMTVPDAIAQIRKAVDTGADDMIVGVGTVLNAETAAEAIGAGARYVVSPILKDEIIKACKDRNTIVIPGAFTPTEICRAQELGADLVKVFPADVLGMEFFKSVKAPMPELRIIPTGGVSLTNAADWIRAGASAVGIGSALLDKEAIRNRNFDAIRQNAEKLKENLESVN